MARIIGTLVDVRREHDRQAGLNAVYVVDCDGVIEQAVDHHQNVVWPPQVGAQVTIVGPRSVDGRLSVDTLDVQA